MAARLSQVLRPAIVSEDGETAAHTLRVFRHEPAVWMLAADDAPTFAAQGATEACWHLIRQLWRAWHPGRRWLMLAHAAGVAVPEGAILLAGKSGAGKSTLAGALVAAGFHFLADDLLPIEAGREAAWPVPLAISVKPGSWPIWCELLPELCRQTMPPIEAGGVRYLWPELAQRLPARTTTPVRVAIFPTYQSGAETALSRLTPLDFVARLGASGSLFPETDEDLEAFLGWAERTPAYALTYGRLDEAVAAVRALAT